MNPNLNKLLQAALDKHHIELSVCASQKEALRAMLKENFCLAVMDASMIETDKAIQFISDFRLETYAPILVLSTGGIVMRILNAGADMCFSSSASSELIVFHALSALRRYTLYNLYDEKNPGEVLGLTWDNIHISDSEIANDDAHLCVEKELARIKLSTIDTLGSEKILKVFPQVMYRKSASTLTCASASPRAANL